VVIDDGWQRQYGRSTPDPARWPDLRGWVAARHQEGKRVLLWWKAWDPTGVPAEWCITDPAGRPVAVDPGHPSAAALLAENIASVLGDDGLDADGLKVDFTARSPSGYSLRCREGGQVTVGRTALGHTAPGRTAPGRTAPGRTGTGQAGAWGIALLHEHLRQIYTAAKAAKADALVITQTPHPGFVDVTDMVRLNDMLRLDDASPHGPPWRAPPARSS
jgi:hypothetical protein